MQSVHVIEGVPEPNQLAGMRVFPSAVTCKLLIVCAAVLSTLPAFAHAGKLDPTFGNRGVTTTTIYSSDIARLVGIGLQSTGKIEIGLSTAFGADDDGFTLVRFNPNGTIYTTFGRGGSVKVSPFKLSYIVPSVQSNGEIVLAGSGSVARFIANGALYTGFWTSGVASVHFGSITSTGAEPNGNILLGTGSQLLGTTPPQG
jgi:hypothetical protein